MGENAREILFGRVLGRDLFLREGFGGEIVGEGFGSTGLVEG